MYIKLEKHPEVEWEDCSMAIFCLFCGEEISLDSQDEGTTCDCGNMFHLSTVIYHVIEGEDK